MIHCRRLDTVILLSEQQKNHNNGPQSSYELVQMHYNLLKALLDVKEKKIKKKKSEDLNRSFVDGLSTGCTEEH